MKNIVCKECEKEIEGKVSRGMCITCYRQWHSNNKTKTYDLPQIGEVKYSPEGLVICHICGKAYKKLLSHVWQKHGIDEKEYKRTFGLNTSQGLICESTRKKLQDAVKKHYDTVVTNNIVKNGEKTRFYKGSEGRVKSKISVQELNRLTTYGKSMGLKNLKPFQEKKILQIVSVKLN